MLKIASRLMVVSLLWIGAASAAQAQTATDTVERLNALLLEVMQGADDLGYQGRVERLEAPLIEIFDYPLMSRVAVGPHWNEIGTPGKDRLVNAFARLSVATFADRFDGYDGERFVVSGEEEGPRGTTIVNNSLIKSDGEEIQLNYLVRQDGAGDYRIIDVYLDGTYSEMAVKRSEYTEVIENDSFDELIERMGEIVDELAADNA